MKDNSFIINFLYSVWCQWELSLIESGTQLLPRPPAIQTPYLRGAANDKKVIPKVKLTLQPQEPRASERLKIIEAMIHANHAKPLW